jgi:hypothetical protein
MKMAKATYYAWTPIRTATAGEVTGFGTQMKVGLVKVGEEVSASSLGVSDEDFQEMVNSGAVRPQEFPELPPNYQDSPINHIRRAVRALEENLTLVSGGFNESLLRSTLSGRLQVEPEETDEEFLTQGEADQRQQEQADQQEQHPPQNLQQPPQNNLNL